MTFEITFGHLVGIALGMMFAPIFRNWYADYKRPTWRVRRLDDGQDFHWKPWFAWRPVKTITGHTIWWGLIYRSRGNDYVDHDDWAWYHYGTLFDVLEYS